MAKVHQCTLCNASEAFLTNLLSLPNLPLSETYGRYDKSVSGYDQSILLCEKCGHVQLAEQLPPSLLYSNDNYHYQTGKSGSTAKRFISFKDFVSRTSNSQGKTLLDIGGNDASLLGLFSAARKFVIDPSASQSDQKGEVTVLSGMVEAMDITDINPDLVMCTHTLEHIADPVGFICHLFSQCADDTRYYFEVPCVEMQVKAARFDAFFHQHYHYFHAATISKLIVDCGGEMTAMAYNEYPTCGGSLMFAFKKGLGGGTAGEFNTVKFQALFQQRLKAFTQMNEQIASFIESKAKVVGYGASLLLPVIFYHIGKSAQRIIQVLDDDPEKKGLTYRNLANVEVIPSSEVVLGDDDGVLITSYENVEVLSKVIKQRFSSELFTGYVK